MSGTVAGLPRETFKCDGVSVTDSDGRRAGVRVTDMGADDMGLGAEFWEANRRRVIEAERASDNLSLFDETDGEPEPCRSPRAPGPTV
jgi:hypothetical protein